MLATKVGKMLAQTAPIPETPVGVSRIDAPMPSDPRNAESTA